MTSEEDFFQKLEKELAIQIPIFLRNILKINGLTNSLALKNLQEKDIDELEIFVRQDLKDLIEEEEYENYFGDLFKKNPSKFKFLVGYRKLLLEIAGYLNKNSEENNKERTEDSRKNPSCSTPRGKIFKKTVSQAASSAEASAAQISVKQVSQNLTEENAAIGRLLKKWLSQNFQKFNVCEDNCQRILSNMLDNNNYYCHVDKGGNLRCTLICCLCDYRTVIRQMTKNRNCFWSLSNFYTHFGKHLENLTNIKKQNQASLLSYYKSTPSTSSWPCEEGTSTQDCQEDSQGDSVVELQFRKKRIRTIESDSDDSESGELYTSNTNTQVFSENRATKLGTSSSVTLESSTKNTKKWSSIKYSRIERNKRAREKITEYPSKQPLLTKYFKPIDEMEKLIQENTQLKKLLHEGTKILSQENDAININESKNLSNFLSCLLETATTNSKKKSSKANVFDDEIKQFCLYLYIIGGRLLYETLYSNLRNAIPSLTTLLRGIDNSNIEEGTLRLHQLNTFLQERNLPKVVWISEDATKITGKIQYNTKNNKLVGFATPLENGFPKEHCYMATSARQIQTYFLNEPRANYAYVLMAQVPEDKCPSFCISIFGTDNRFTFRDVLLRWSKIEQEAQQLGIKILGYSSDGDSRLLKAMRMYSSFNSNTRDGQVWKWFHMDLNDNKFCVQDTVHIGTKLRTRLLHENVVLHMGNFVVSKNHLQYLITHYSKDKHFLTLTDINGEDKMNYRSVEKIMSPEVSTMLKTHVADSDATIIYLKIMRSVITAYLNKDIDLKQRIHLMWYSVFFLRTWRQWLRKTKELSMTKNFISLNAYLCIEINAHTLIKLIRTYRDDENLQGVGFTPWLFSSQPCEQLFRSTRSLTSTFSTIVNFSIQEIINRLNKIETIVNITNDLSDKFVFSREKTSKLGYNKYLAKNIKFLIDEEISIIFTEALEECKVDCNSLGITYEEDDYKNVSIIQKECVETVNEIEEEYLEDELNMPVSDFTTSEKSTIGVALERLEQDTEFEETSEDDVPAVLQEALETNNILDFDEDLNLKNYNVDGINEASPFVQVKIKNQLMTIKKTSLCWLFDERVKRLSSDRIYRFKNTENKIKEINSDGSYPKPNVEIEEYYAVYYSDGWYIGRTIENLEDGKFKIKFLKNSLHVYIWPKKDDIQIVETEFIFFGPIQMLGNNPLSLSENDRIRIIARYKSMKRHYLE